MSEGPDDTGTPSPAAASDAAPAKAAGAPAGASAKKKSSSTFWTRLRTESALPRSAPRWFVALRALSKTGLYGLVVAWVAFIPMHRGLGVVLWTIVAVLWLTIAVATVMGWMHRRRTSESQFARWSDLAMLLAPLPILFGLPLITVALLVVGYGLQLRRISGGQVFIFALFASVLAVVLATIALIGAESQVPGSALSSPTSAVGYTLSSLFRLTNAKSVVPVTQEGRTIGSILQVVSAIFLGALYGGLLTMVVKDSSKSSTAAVSSTDARLAYVIKQQKEILARLDALSAAVPPAAPPVTPAPPAPGDAEKAPDSATS